jgi:hypothetical protein
MKKIQIWRLKILVAVLFSVVLISLTYYTGLRSLYVNLQVGFASSIIFYFFVVWLPERQKNKIIKENLGQTYSTFKKRMVDIILSLVEGCCNYDDSIKLLDHTKLKAFLDSNNRENLYKFYNQLEDRQDYLDEIIFEFEILSKEIEYTLNHAQIKNKKSFARLKNIVAMVYMFRHTQKHDYEKVKCIANQVLSLLTRFNMMDGQLEYDIIQETIDSL